jgi:hypothetical protein
MAIYQVLKTLPERYTIQFSSNPRRRDNIGSTALGIQLMQVQKASLSIGQRTFRGLAFKMSQRRPGFSLPAFPGPLDSAGKLCNAAGEQQIGQGGSAAEARFHFMG